MLSKIHRFASRLSLDPRRTVLVVVLAAALGVGVWFALRVWGGSRPGDAPGPVARVAERARRGALLHETDLELAVLAAQLDGARAEATLHRAVTRIERRLDDLDPSGDAFGDRVEQLRMRIGRDPEAARPLIDELRVAIAEAIVPMSDGSVGPQAGGSR